MGCASRGPQRPVAPGDNRHRRFCRQPRHSSRDSARLARRSPRDGVCRLTCRAKPQPPVRSAEEVGEARGSHPRAEEAIRRGHIYIAPPDRHMLIEDGTVCLSRGPREHFTRPAIDPLFRSAARSCGGRVIGVVLSGSGSDGAAGLAAVQHAGGLTVIEDPFDAAFPDMPNAGASIGKPDFIVRAAEIPSLLVDVSAEVVPAETARAQKRAPVGVEMDELEAPIAFSCPECGGALRIQSEGRCSAISLPCRAPLRPDGDRRIPIGGG
jgi:hypothetical protein